MHVLGASVMGEGKGRERERKHQLKAVSSNYFCLCAYSSAHPQTSLRRHTGNTELNFRMSLAFVEQIVTPNWNFDIGMSV